MSLAIPPRATRTRSYVVIEYTTADGTVLRLRVSPAVAEVLASDGPALREMTLTDLAGKKRRRKDDGRPGLDPELMLAGVARRVAKRRQREGAGSPWEGPKYHFDVMLGMNRPGWLGGPCVDEAGRCGICHGAKLLPVVYCGACDRSGRDGAIESGGRSDLAPRRPPARFRPRGSLAPK